MVEQITLYTSEISPFPHSVEIALAEAGASDKAGRYIIGLSTVGQVKPAWYTEKVNPLGTVPAIAYGPQPSPDQPISSSIKMFESQAVVEFVVELFPQGNLVPSDLIDRARARSFVAASNSAIIANWAAALGGNNIDPFFKIFDLVQALLPGGTKYAVGDEFTIADLPIGAWFTRIELLLRNDFFGKFGKGIGLKAFETYESPKYDKLREYARRVQERPSVKNTFHEDVFYNIFKERLSLAQ